MTTELRKDFNSSGMDVRKAIEDSTKEYYGEIEDVLAELRKLGTDVRELQWVCGYPTDDVKAKSIFYCQLDLVDGQHRHTIDRRWLVRKSDMPTAAVDEDDCRSEDEPVCPHCGHKQDTADGFGVQADGDQNEVACEHCDEDFVVVLNVSYSYTTSPKGGWARREPVR